jgi:hypothetical protein
MINKGIGRLTAPANPYNPAIHQKTIESPASVKVAKENTSGESAAVEQQAKMPQRGSRPFVRACLLGTCAGVTSFWALLFLAQVQVIPSELAAVLVSYVNIEFATVTLYLVETTVATVIALVPVLIAGVISARSGFQRSNRLIAVVTLAALLWHVLPVLFAPSGLVDRMVLLQLCEVVLLTPLLLMVGMKIGGGLDRRTKGDVG